MSLAKSLLTAQQAQAEAAQKAAAASLAKESISSRIAQAYDAQAGHLDLPKLPSLFVHELHGKVASLSFSRPSKNFPDTGISAQQVVDLLQALPPQPAGVAKGTFTSWMSEAFFESQKAGGKYTTFTPSPVVVSVDRIETRCTVKVHWLTLLDGLTVEVQAELSRLQGNFTIWADTRHHNGILVEIKRQDLVMTGDIKGLHKPLYLAYAAGSEVSFRSYLMHSSDGHIVRILHKMAELDAEYLAGALKAYNDDKLAGLPPVPKTPTDLTGMNAGSKAQREELNSLGARRDQALAKQHWPMYCREHKLDTRQSYFEHYVWAKHWLTQAGLQPDPGYLVNGEPYSYGSSWLAASQEV